MTRAFVYAAVMVAALTSSLFAQWPLHQAAGVPKTPDGKVDLNAPAPRTADGKPDLSGIWMARPGVDVNPPPGRPPLANFGNAGVGMKGDLPFQPWARELQKKRASENSKENPDGLCLPESLLQLHLDPQPLKVVQTPAAIYIIYETNYGLRTIFMDGRSLPPQGAPQPFWYGYSVGRWEGDTLVVETNNYRGDGWLDARAVRSRRRRHSPSDSGASITVSWISSSRLTIRRPTRGLSLSGSINGSWPTVRS